MPNMELPTTHEAIRALAARRDESVLQIQTDVAASNDEFLRRTAIEVIGNHPHAASLQPIVLKALADPSAYVVRAACDAVAKCEISEAHDLVLSILASGSGSTRQTALRTLSAIWNDGDFSAVFYVYQRDVEIDVRRGGRVGTAEPCGLRKLANAFQGVFRGRTRPASAMGLRDRRDFFRH